jgi:hypothetical protein
MGAHLVDWVRGIHQLDHLLGIRARTQASHLSCRWTTTKPTLAESGRARASDGPASKQALRAEALGTGRASKATGKTSTLRAHTYIYIYIYVYICIHISIYIYIYIYTHPSTYIYTVYIYIYLYISISISLYILYIYIYRYVDM